MTSPTSHTFICSDPEHVNMRLDAFLHRQMPDYSRNYFQTLIDQELVFVNDNPKKKNYHLKPHDVISLTLISSACNYDPVNVPFDVIEEHEDFIIVNKPAGLMVHPAPASPDQLSLVNGLLYRYPEMQSFQTLDRPGIVHRLDKNTSGLLIIARNPKAQLIFSQLFQARQVQKTYLAITSGKLPESGKIDLAIGRHPTERHKMGTSGIDIKPALTFFTAQEYFDQGTLAQVRIVTGRTHQIRVHFAALGHGLLGDQTYGVSTPLINRQALHAFQLSFSYNGNPFNYQAPLPEDFLQLLESLRQK